MTMEMRVEARTCIHLFESGEQKTCGSNSKAVTVAKKME